MDDEDFNLDASSILSENATTMPLSQAAPSSISVQQPEIRAELAGKKSDDITPFFEVDGDKKKCKYCL